MRFLRLIISIQLLASSTLVKAQVIKWQENRPLTWDDFKGRPDLKRGSVAVTYRRIVYDYHCEFKEGRYLVTFSLESIFDQKISWVIRGTETNYILGHEQLHFDINELYTRKFAAALNSQIFTSNYKVEIDSIYHKILDDCNKMEARYDIESKHSDDKNMQYQWQIFIYLELKNLPRNY